MKTKQIISLALMLALLVTVITGCGTKEGSSTNNNEESTSVVSAEMKENEYSAKDEHPDRFELNSAAAQIEQSNRRN